MYIDAHCHLERETYGDELDEVIARAFDAGLTHIHVSLHSYRPEVHNFITAYPNAWETLVTTLSHVPEMGITADINCVICVKRPSATESLNSISTMNSISSGLY